MLETEIKKLTAAIEKLNATLTENALSGAPVGANVKAAEKAPAPVPDTQSPPASAAAAPNLTLAPASGGPAPTPAVALNDLQSRLMQIHQQLGDPAPLQNLLATYQVKRIGDQDP